MNENYRIKLKDPKWIERANNIRHLDDYECIDCGLSFVKDKDKLDVHHTYYDFNKEIYDYPDKNLICLCHSCHSKEHKIGKSLDAKFKKYLKSLKKEGLLSSQIDKIMDTLIDISENNSTISNFSNICKDIDLYNWGRITSRDLRHKKVKNEDNELKIWIKICNSNNIIFDKNKIETSEYQSLWENYFKI